MPTNIVIIGITMEIDFSRIEKSKYCRTEIATQLICSMVSLYYHRDIFTLVFMLLSL